MATLAIAFLLAWWTVSCYLGWLGLQQRQLRRRLDALELTDRSEDVRDSYSRAA